MNPARLHFIPVFVSSLSCFWIYLPEGRNCFVRAYRSRIISRWPSKMRNGSINFLERNDWIRGRDRNENERKARAWIESIVGNREKYALIRAGAGNLWICGEPDAYRQWPTSRDGYNHRLLRCYSSTVNQVRCQFSSCPARPTACCVASRIFVQLIVLIDLRYDL